jgi:hypothetical protein
MTRIKMIAKKLRNTAAVMPEAGLSSSGVEGIKVVQDATGDIVRVEDQIDCQETHGAEKTDGPT